VSLGIALTKWTIWVALLGYALGAVGLLLARREPRWWSLARLAWTAGCVAYLGHVYSAFQFYHGWSHSSAFEETARQTREAVGWEVGEGLFVSYFFTAAWLADVIWWWRASAQNYARRPRVFPCVAPVFFFIVFNATVVFESGAVCVGCSWRCASDLQACGGAPVRKTLQPATFGCFSCQWNLFEATLWLVISHFIERPQ
jgi:hypothetical protein